MSKDCKRSYEEVHKKLGEELEKAQTRAMRMNGLLLDDPATPWPLKRLAALAGYSPWHFLRRFRRETGLTPHAFHLLCRLRLARALLRAEAAVSAGFTDQSHLHKLFRRQHGMTPGQFRRASLRLEA